MNSLSIDVTFQRKGFCLDVTADIPGEGICVLLGPSGSGKTTLMRLIAGLEQPEQGTISLNEQIWIDTSARINVPIGRRRVGIVFQDYALFENMTVADNIGYGVAKPERAAEVVTWLERLDLGGLAQRYPSQLSGGQRQRVALARALAPDPELLLLDEPFSAVDAHLRAQLRAQLMGLVTAVKKPVIMVTHDLEEARQMADTVGIVSKGRLCRFGPTHDVFDDPADYGVACVLGWRNLLPVEQCSDGVLAGSWGKIRISQHIPARPGWLGIRPEHIGFGPGLGSSEVVKVVRVREMGAVRELQCRLKDGTALFLHRPWNMPLPLPGDELHVHFPSQHLRLIGNGTSTVGLRLDEHQPDRPAVKARPKLTLV